jgi:hypothetical protein
MGVCTSQYEAVWIEEQFNNESAVLQMYDKVHLASMSDIVDSDLKGEPIDLIPLTDTTKVSLNWDFKRRPLVRDCRGIVCSLPFDNQRQMLKYRRVADHLRKKNLNATAALVQQVATTPRRRTRIRESFADYIATQIIRGVMQGAIPARKRILPRDFSTLTAAINELIEKSELTI